MLRPAALLVPLLTTGCAADFALRGDSDDLGGGDGASTGDGGAGGGGEVEDAFFGLAPSASPVYLFIANPDRDTLTRVTVPSLQVITTTVGDRPIQVQTTADYQRAVTFNEAGDSVSIVDAESLAVQTVAVRSGFNRMALSPDGRFVLCWHDSDSTETESNDEGAQSFNEVSLVDTQTLAHTPMVVGFNPRDVQFTADSGLAVIVSDAYLAMVDLSATSPAPRRVAISEDLVDPPLAEEVLLTPDGRYAFVRQYGASELGLVDLRTAQVDRIAVGDNPTDLDLTPDGLRAVAVARDSRELWLYDLADPYAAAKVVELPSGESLGSVVMSPDGRRGLLYSTVSGSSRYATWELDSDEITVRALVKPVRAMGVSPDGRTALVFHDKANGDTPADSVFYNQYALTMIAMDEDFFSNPLRLPAEPMGYAHSDDGARGYLVMEDEALLEVLEYDSLLYEEVLLKSAALHVGTVPTTTLAWVNQEHELGRLSFYDPDTGALQTLTGFELNAGIEY